MNVASIWRFQSESNKSHHAPCLYLINQQNRSKTRTTLNSNHDNIGAEAGSWTVTKQHNLLVSHGSEKKTGVPGCVIHRAALIRQSLLRGGGKLDDLGWGWGVRSKDPGQWGRGTRGTSGHSHRALCGTLLSSGVRDGDIDGWAQDCGKVSVSAMELLQPCSKPLMW